jgi:hypothetical protein
MTKFQKFTIGIILVIIGLNLIGLWTVQILQMKKQPTGTLEQTKIAKSNQAPSTSGSTSDSTVSAGSKDQAEQKVTEKPTEDNSEKSTDNSTLEKLANNLEKLTARILKLETTPATGGTTIINKTSPVNFQKQTLYLGTAETTSREWTDTSVEIKLNHFYYPEGVTATFEAAISIVGGEGFARLKNKTTGLVLYETEVNHNTGTATWKTSNKFGLRYNENTYQVQLRSSSGEKVKMEGARIIIDK